MLMIKKGKQKTQVFKVAVCDKCGAEYIYIESAYKTKFKDVFTDEAIYVADVYCENCKYLLRIQTLTHELYEKKMSEVKVTQKDGCVRKLTEKEMFMYV